MEMHGLSGCNNRSSLNRSFYRLILGVNTAGRLIVGAIFQMDMLDFMAEIRFNNNKSFMQAHRDEYIRRMRTPYYRLIEALAPTMTRIDPEMEVRPSKVLSRIFRDTRYSHDKSPYRDHHWIAFRRRGEPREQSVMYWFEIRLDAVGWGLGFWGENRNAFDALRKRMVSNPNELLGLLPILKRRSFILEGEKYKRMKTPDNLREELHPWYTSKEIYLVKQGVQPSWAFEGTLTNRLEEDFVALSPFYQLFRGYYDISN